MRSFKKLGDDGQTDLLYGGRILKSSLRVEAYGTVDEAVSAIGIARALTGDEKIRSILLKIQRELFTIGAELATEPSEYDKLVKRFGQTTPSMVKAIEETIEAYEETTEMPSGFVVPGANAVSSHLDLARAIVRRAERRSVELREKQGLVNEQVLRYLNRLADLLFLLARAEERGATTLLREPQVHDQQIQ